MMENSNLDFKGEVLLQVLDDHDKERKLDPKGCFGIGRAGDESCATFVRQPRRKENTPNVCTSDFNNK
jgi:hypothetical protein